MYLYTYRIFAVLMYVKSCVFEHECLNLLLQVIKLYAWELPFQGIISKTRQQELHELKKIAYLNAITVFTWSCAPLLVRLRPRHALSITNIITFCGYFD